MDLFSFHGLCACEILYAQGRIVIGCTKTKATSLRCFLWIVMGYYVVAGL